MNITKLIAFCAGIVWTINASAQNEADQRRAMNVFTSSACLLIKMADFKELVLLLTSFGAFALVRNAERTLPAAY